MGQSLSNNVLCGTLFKSDKSVPKSRAKDLCNQVCGIKEFLIGGACAEVYILNDSVDKQKIVEMCVCKKSMTKQSSMGLSPTSINVGA